MRRQLDGARVLLEHLNVGRLGLAADEIHAASLGKAILGVDVTEVAINHEVDADIGTALLARLGEKDDVPIERYRQALQHQDRHQAGNDMRLVIKRTAAVNVAAVADRSERRELPLCRIDRHHVCVAHQQKSSFLSVSLDSRDEIRAIGLQRK